MGNVFSDMLGIESASAEFATALKEAEANATIELRNVALTAINYVKSFTPVISLILVFIILLLLVSVLFILNRMLDDLQISKLVRRNIVMIVSILLYIWFVTIQIIGAVKQKSPITIAIATLAGIGLIVITIVSIWFACRTRATARSNSTSESELTNMSHRK